jgi:hypothetical protein
MKKRTCNSCHEEISGLACKNCFIHKNYLIVMLALFVLAIFYYCSLLFHTPQPDDYIQTTTIIFQSQSSCRQSNMRSSILFRKLSNQEIKSILRHNQRSQQQTRMQVRRNGYFIEL